MFRMPLLLALNRTVRVYGRQVKKSTRHHAVSETSSHDTHYWLSYQEGRTQDRT